MKFTSQKSAKTLIAAAALAVMGAGVATAHEIEIKRMSPNSLQDASFEEVYNKPNATTLLMGKENSSDTLKDLGGKNFQLMEIWAFELKSEEGESTEKAHIPRPDCSFMKERSSNGDFKSSLYLGSATVLEENPDSQVEYDVIAKADDNKWTLTLDVEGPDEADQDRVVARGIAQIYCQGNK